MLKDDGTEAKTVGELIEALVGPIADIHARRAGPASEKSFAFVTELSALIVRHFGHDTPIDDSVQNSLVEQRAYLYAIADYVLETQLRAEQQAKAGN